MGYLRFLQTLFDTGRVEVAEGSFTDEMLSGDDLILEIETNWRKTLCGTPPEFTPLAARWAGIRLFQACQLTVFRDMDMDSADFDSFAEAIDPSSPSVHYSVDLVFRFLPDLLNFAKAASPTDPLLRQLYTWAGEWPLSSIGIGTNSSTRVEIEPDNEDADPRSNFRLSRSSIELIASHPCLLQMYVDRIMNRNDISRLDHDGIRRAVATSLGMHDQLNPTISDALQTFDHPS